MPWREAGDGVEVAGLACSTFVDILRDPSWRRKTLSRMARTSLLVSFGRIRKLMSRLKISAISYLNTAPLMWDFEHAAAGADAVSDLAAGRSADQVPDQIQDYDIS